MFNIRFVFIKPSQIFSHSDGSPEPYKAHKGQTVFLISDHNNKMVF